MYKFALVSQNSMASFVFTLIVAARSHKKLSAIYCFEIVTGDESISRLKRINKLLKNSSLKFGLYKFFETYIFMIFLKIFKFFKLIKFSTIEDIANYYDVPFFKFKDVNDKEFIDNINGLTSNHFSVFTSGQIVKNSTLKQFNNYPINCHGSFLPELRGPAQYIWYPVKDYKYYGITFNNLKYEIDSGDILYQKRFETPENISSFYLHYLIAEKWGIEFNKLIQIIEFPPKVMKQKKEDITLVSLPDAEAFKILKSKNQKIIKISDALNILSNLKPIF